MTVEDNNTTDNERYASIVRMYFDTARRHGFPYFHCPPALQPVALVPDVWWVVYAPSIDGGYIIEGYHIEEWQNRLSNWSIAFCAFGILLFYFGLYVMHVFGLVLWTSALLGAVGFFIWFAVCGYIGWLVSVRRVVNKSEYICFPVSLRQALANKKTDIDKHNAKAIPRHLLVGLLCRGSSMIFGGMLEPVVGKLGSKITELAIEAAFERSTRSWTERQ